MIFSTDAELVAEVTDILGDWSGDSPTDRAILAGVSTMVDEDADFALACLHEALSPTLS